MNFDKAEVKTIVKALNALLDDCENDIEQAHIDGDPEMAMRAMALSRAADDLHLKIFRGQGGDLD